jgi:putative flippase GtrA
VYIFLKSNVASISATALDYLMTFALVHYWGMDVIVATITGTVSGGILNFAMSRTWVFGAGSEKASGQMAKYLLVWAGNIALTTTGVYLLNKDMGVHYLVAKAAVSVSVGVCYNYLLQKRFVFASERAQ